MFKKQNKTEKWLINRIDNLNRLANNLRTYINSSDSESLEFSQAFYQYVYESLNEELGGKNVWVMMYAASIKPCESALLMKEEYLTKISKELNGFKSALVKYVVEIEKKINKYTDIFEMVEKVKECKNKKQAFAYIRLCNMYLQSSYKYSADKFEEYIPPKGLEFLKEYTLYSKKYDYLTFSILEGVLEGIYIRNGDIGDYLIKAQDIDTACKSSKEQLEYEKNRLLLKERNPIVKFIRLFNKNF